MLSPWTVYFITMLDNWRNVCVGVLVVAGIAVFSIAIALPLLIDILGKDSVWRFFKKIVYISIPAVLLLCILPTSKQAAAIYLIPKVVNNERLKGVASDGMKALRLLENKWIQELSLAPSTPEQPAK